MEGRAALHRALGDQARLRVVEAVALSDRTPGELRTLTGLEWNLLNFHLRTLEEAGVVERHGSQGDRRRRYVRLVAGALDRLMIAPRVRASAPLFVCTHNSARSPFAAARWEQRTGRPAGSAGRDPASAVHPLAVEVAAGYGLDLAGARPRGFDAVEEAPDVVVSVCDRAFETGVPFDAPRLHWSVPDPSAGNRDSFEAAFADIAERIDRLAGAGA